MAVVHVHFRRGLHVRIAVAIKKSHPHHILKSLAAHSPSIHAQGAADFARNAFHPLQSANTGVASGIRDLFQLCSDTSSDLVALHFDAVELAAARMNNHAANSAIANK